MNKYYDETICEITEAINQKRYEEALHIIQKELSMPYLPIEFEQVITQLKDDVLFAIGNQNEIIQEPLETLLHNLTGSSTMQLMAAERLSKHNLRSCVQEIYDYLAKDPCPEAASLVIEALAEQEIDSTFEMTKNGIEYSFNPDTIIPVAKSEGFHAALHYLESLLYMYPAMLEMAKTLLIHEAYMQLPLSITIEEAPFIVHEIVENLSQMIDDGKTWNEIKLKI